MTAAATLDEEVDAAFAEWLLFARSVPHTPNTPYRPGSARAKEISRRFEPVLRAMAAADAKWDAQA